MFAGVLEVAPTKLGLNIFVSTGSAILTKDRLTGRFTRGVHTLGLAVVAGKSTIFLVEALTPTPITLMLGFGPHGAVTHGTDPVTRLEFNLIHHRDIISGI